MNGNLRDDDYLSNNDYGNRGYVMPMNDEYPTSEFKMTLRNWYLYAPAEDESTQVFLYDLDKNDYTWDSYDARKFQRVSPGQLAGFVKELKSVPHYQMGSIFGPVAKWIWIGFLIWLALGGATIWMAEASSPELWQWWIIIPVGGFVIFVIFMQAARSVAGKRIKARVIAMDSIMKEWNLKCFYPAGYSLAPGHLCAYFVLAGKSPAPGNVVKIVHDGQVMVGYPGIPTGYTPGQSQPAWQKKSMFMVQPGMPAQNAQPYTPPPNPGMDHAKGGANFEYPNSDL